MAETYKVKAGDTLNSIAKQYGFNTYKEAGITEVPSGNFDMIRVGDQITIGGAKPAGSGAAPAPTSTTTPAPGAGASGEQSGPDLLAMINGEQDNDMESARAEEGPGTRSSVESTSSFFENLTKTINDALGTTEKPETPSFSERYGDLRKAFSVADLESEMSTLKAEERELQATKRERIAGAREKRVAQGVIAGRVSTIERQEDERLDSNLREQAYLNDQLTTKYNVINTILNLEQTDYTNATQSYDRQYQQVVDTLNLARGFRSDEITEKEREETAARANLQIMYNALSSGQADFDSLDPAAIATITKLEVQSGLPVGFYQALKAKAGMDQMISTASREVGGVAYTDIIMQKPDGSFYVETLSRGAVKGTGSGDDDEFEYTTADERILLGVGLTKDRIDYLAKGVSEYGLEEVIKSENLTDEQAKALREVHGIKEEEPETEQFTGDQKSKIAIALVKALGGVDKAKEKVRTGSLTISGSTKKLTDTDMAALEKAIDEEYPAGRTTAQKYLPFGK